jgi:hypothetical protein
MYAGIGSARALRQYFFAGNPSDSRGESALDRRAVGLNLPTAKVRAVVSQRQLDVTHAEIESSGMKVHPRLHRLHVSAMEMHAHRLGYTGESLRLTQFADFRKWPQKLGTQQYLFA